MVLSNALNNLVANVSINSLHLEGQKEHIVMCVCNVQIYVWHDTRLCARHFNDKWTHLRVLCEQQRQFLLIQNLTEPMVQQFEYNSKIYRYCKQNNSNIFQFGIFIRRISIKWEQHNHRYNTIRDMKLQKHRKKIKIEK